MKEIKPLVIINILCFASLFAFVPIASSVVRKLNLEEWHAGLIVSLTGVAWIFLSRFWGKKSDIFGRRNILLIAMIGFFISYLFLAIFIDYATINPPLVIVSLIIFTFIRVLNGGFYSAIPPVSSALIADKVEPEKRNSYMASLGASNGIGTILGSVFAGALAIYGLAVPIYVATFLLVIATFIIFFFFKKDKRIYQTKEEIKAKLSLSFFDKRLRLVMFTGFLVTFANITSQICIGFFILDKFSLVEEEGAKIIGYIMTIIGIAYILTQITVSKIKFIKPINWLILGSIFAMLGYFLISFISSPIQLTIAYLITTVGFGMLIPAYMTITANSVEANEQGVAAGTVSSMSGFAVIIAPLLSTLFYEIDLTFPFIFSGIAFLVLIIITFFYKNKET
ncbi:MFS transporter [Aliarcobacter butzleri]|uniref:MFS transporter n=1 Tax=Aliarcobacter butzleri TaxID=28197 RepID=UPI0021B1F70B|nr:MFS transporter [Aliarcobacter butzleri]MCT7618250.1 MFS transporter [Aliarcobacter butzleri]